MPYINMKQTILILASLIGLSGMSVATPSRPIQINDTLALVQRLSVEDMEVSGITNPISFDYDGQINRWMVMTATPVQVSIRTASETGLLEGKFNIFELDPATLSVVDAHLALPMEEDASLEPVALMRDDSGGGFLVLDRATGSILRYAYLPDEEQVLIENATRWVEIPVEQDPIEVEEEYEIEVDAPEDETDEVTEAEEAGENAVDSGEEVSGIESTEALVPASESPRKLIRKAVRRTWVTPEPKIERERKWGQSTHSNKIGLFGDC